MIEHRIKQIIKERFGCEAQFTGFQPVNEQFDGQTAWQGTVEIFDLIGHPTAKGVYAWQDIEQGQSKIFTVLKIPPVDSPQTAVKMVIAAKAWSNTVNSIW